MRKILILTAIVAAFASMVPAQAGTTYRRTATFKGTPCAATCAYWVPKAPSAPSAPKVPADPTTADPVAFADKVLDIPFGVIDSTDSQSAACTAPSPAGSFADVVATAPKGTNYLVFSATPTVDWDLFICAKPTRGNNGKLLAVGANPVADANDPTMTCAIGCYEEVHIPVVAGRKYVLRAYNWSDPDNLTAKYTFRHI